ncbi:DNA adenine methylase [Micromonospora marina]|uniref:site-specific DNA-methyltransferase (adenine-specific) n=2 Tax=Micromonospora marina TaxID=307120 RepID=A0A1C4YKG0_9ACTN|nr:DNA adenine methylase [Micromonospora marina]
MSAQRIASKSAKGDQQVPAARGLAAVPPVPPEIGPTARKLPHPSGLLDHPLARARYQTPLRYPGAKTGLADLIGRLIGNAVHSPQVGKVDLLVEPFAGGASTSLRLVGSGVVDRVLLADADPLVAAFWQVAAAETENLVDRVCDEHARFVSLGGQIALDRWDYWRAWTPRPGTSAATARFEAAVKCLFLNRTTFSGILHGQAGPIGGRSQTSAYGIGCRFTLEPLMERVRYVGWLYGEGRLVDVWCKHWERTLADVPEWYPQLIPNHVVAYLDPPYLEKSDKLYQKSFNPNGGYGASPVSDLHWSNILPHQHLAEYLRRRIQFRWILSYDSHASLLSDPALYLSREMTPSAHEREVLGVRRWRISKRLVSLRYTASARKGRGPADELLLTTLPPSTVPTDDDFRPLGE